MGAEGASPSPVFSGTRDILASIGLSVSGSAGLCARLELEKERRLKELALTEPENGSVKKDVDDVERSYVGLDGGDDKLDSGPSGGEDDDDGSAARCLNDMSRTHRQGGEIG